jgi:hypothetical protein
VSRRPYASTTRAALWLVLGVTVAFLAFAVAEIVALVVGPERKAEQTIFGLTPDAARNGMVFSAALVLLACLLTATLAFGLARRRPGARYAAIPVFLLFGCLSLAGSLAGLAADPPARNAALGLLNGVVCLAVVALLARQATADDFGRAEVERQRMLARGTAH